MPFAKAYNLQHHHVNDSKIHLKDCGIGSIPNWKLRYSYNEIHKMKILLIGQNGSGKASLINTLFGTKIIDRSIGNDFFDSNFNRHSAFKEESSIKMSIIIDEYNNDSYDPSIVQEKLMDSMHSYHLGRGEPYDFLLYILSPSIQKLTHKEIELFKLIGGLTTIIPILSKADSYTLKELQEKKKIIREQLYSNLIIPIPNITQDHSDLCDIFKKIKNMLPFSIISHNSISKDGGKRIRQYEWGSVTVDDEKFSDIFSIQILLIEKFFLLNKRYIHYYQYLEVWKDIFDGNNDDYNDGYNDGYSYSGGEYLNSINNRDLEPEECNVQDEEVNTIESIDIFRENTNEMENTKPCPCDETIIFTDPFKRLSLTQSKTMSSDDSSFTEGSDNETECYEEDGEEMEKLKNLEETCNDNCCAYSNDGVDDKDIKDIADSKYESERKRIQNEILKQRTEERESSVVTMIEDLRPPLPEATSFTKLNVHERKEYFEKERMMRMRRMNE